MSSKVYDEKWMTMALRLATENVASGQGGPFGAVIVKDGELVAKAGNNVLGKNDPTCHAEVEAIRAAAQALNNWDLTGCEIYSSCEPCPMCLGAVYWARLAKLYYAATREDSQDAGFSDALIYKEMALDPKDRALPTEPYPNHPLRHEGFEAWAKQEEKIVY
jgi:tRNA(Arg) A34 adenosine deaminase TadA